MPDVPRFHAHVPRIAAGALLVAVLATMAAAAPSPLPTSAVVRPNLQSTEGASPTAEPTSTASESTPTPTASGGHVHSTEAPSPTGFPSETQLPSGTAPPASATPASATSVPATPTAGPHGIEPYPAAPLCADHDPREYHGLWDAQRGCHYDHTHGDDPHSVDDIFGTAVYDLMGGEISYPWHTSAENEEIKHKSYLWLVERDLPCYSQYANGCITAFRAFVHNDLYNPGPSHHSGLLEAIVCDESRPNRCGYVLLSGHQATGDLFIDRRVVKNGEEPPRSPRPQMLHYDLRGNRNFATWYPVFFAWMRIATEVSDMWGYYPVTSQARPQDFVPLPGNASRVQAHVISAGLRQRDLPRLDADGDGRLNYNGFVDVMTGELGGACVAVSSSCAPIVFRDVPRVAGLTFQYRGGTYHEFDVFFGRRSSGWLVFPGFQP